MDIMEKLKDHHNIQKKNSIHTQFLHVVGSPLSSVPPSQTAEKQKGSHRDSNSQPKAYISSPEPKWKLFGSAAGWDSQRSVAVYIIQCYHFPRSPSYFSYVICYYSTLQAPNMQTLFDGTPAQPVIQCFKLHHTDQLSFAPI